VNFFKSPEIFSNNKSALNFYITSQFGNSGILFFIFLADQAINSNTIPNVAKITSRLI